MLNLVFVEAALETVPPSIQHHPSVRRDAKRRGKEPASTLLDRSLHHSAMSRLPKNQKRGRPDIVHLCLLSALGTPLNRKGGLKVWVNTLNGFSIEVASEARLPRDYRRFNSLIEQLFSESRVPPKGGKVLMKLELMNLEALMQKIQPSYTIALTSQGKLTTFRTLCGLLTNQENPAVFIGAYPSGSMESETLYLSDESVSIHQEPLEAWIVTSRLLYELENTLGGV